LISRSNLTILLESVDGLIAINARALEFVRVDAWLIARPCTSLFTAYVKTDLERAEFDRVTGVLESFCPFSQEINDLSMLLSDLEKMMRKMIGRTCVNVAYAAFVDIKSIDQSVIDADGWTIEPLSLSRFVFRLER